jgi:pyridoxal phosphate enzyme (YggS family)
MQPSIAQKIAEVRQRIDAAARRCGRNPRDIRLVAVGKTQPAAMIREAAAAGAAVIGENYIQEARDKFAALGDLAVQWHFIGHLQTNKAKFAVRQFDLIHTVDSYRLALELDRQAARIGKRQNILLQVNISGEATKWGTDQAQAQTLVRQIATLAHIRINGLMTMPPYFDAPDRARPFFAALRRLAESIAVDCADLGISMRELSMGMTGDFEAAIEEGATLVRIGTAIFGARR